MVVDNCFVCCYQTLSVIQVEVEFGSTIYSLNLVSLIHSDEKFTSVLLERLEEVCNFKVEDLEHVARQ